MDPIRSDVRAELAALAAQLVADSGLDYQSAKRKAARQVFGDGHISAALLPDNDEIDQSLLEHLQLFDQDHDQRVERYRRAALVWMERLADYNPYLAGAAWKGIVAAHAPLHLQTFTDDAKDLEIRLLNDGIHFDVVEVAHFAGRGDVPALTFYWEQDLPILVSLYRYDDLRGALKRQRGSAGAGRAERGGPAAVRELLKAIPDDLASAAVPAAGS